MTNDIFLRWDVYGYGLTLSVITREAVRFYFFLKMGRILLQSDTNVSFTRDGFFEILFLAYFSDGTFCYGLTLMSLISREAMRIVFGRSDAYRYSLTLMSFITRVGARIWGGMGRIHMKRVLPVFWV